MILEVKNGSFSYGSREVLKDISFHLEERKIMTILGPNGVGKTTLLKCIMGFLRWNPPLPKFARPFRWGRYQLRSSPCLCCPGCWPPVTGLWSNGADEMGGSAVDKRPERKKTI